MQIPVLVHRKAVCESALRHFENGILNSVELALNRRVIFWEVRESAQHLQRFLLASLENQPWSNLSAGTKGHAEKHPDLPTWRFRQSRDDGDYYQCKEDLECDRESPGDGGRLKK